MINSLRECPFTPSQVEKMKTITDTFLSSPNENRVKTISTILTIASLPENQTNLSSTNNYFENITDINNIANYFYRRTIDPRHNLDKSIYVTHLKKAHENGKISLTVDKIEYVMDNFLFSILKNLRATVNRLKYTRQIPTPHKKREPTKNIHLEPSKKRKIGHEDSQNGAPDICHVLKKRKAEKEETTTHIETALNWIAAFQNPPNVCPSCFIQNNGLPYYPFKRFDEDPNCFLHNS